MTPYPNSPSPSSNDRTVLRRGIPPVPPPLPPEPDKKPKKLETPILVAIISAVVTLTTAICSSPILLSLVNKIGAPAPTATVQPVAVHNSALPNNPPGGKIIKATFTPIGSGADILEITPTAPGVDPATASPLLEPTFAPATLPPQEPGSSTPDAAAFFQCLRADLWFTYPGSLSPEIRDGCWNLPEWGFSTDQGRLSLAEVPDQDQERGIYLPISGDAEIRFSVQINKLRTRVNKLGFLNFGIVQNDPLSVYTGGYLSYQQIAPGSGSPVRVLISGSNQATQIISDLKAGFQHEVLFSIKGDQMTVYLGGKQTGDPVGLLPTSRAFWIG